MLTQLAAAAVRGASPVIGVNVADNDAVAGRTFHFANLVKQSLPFGATAGPCVLGAEKLVAVDPAGWPTVDFGVCMYMEGGSRSTSWPIANISGVYTVTATGNATVWRPSSEPERCGGVVNQTYDPGTNRLTA